MQQIVIDHLALRSLRNAGRSFELCLHQQSRYLHVATSVTLWVAVLACLATAPASRHDRIYVSSMILVDFTCMYVSVSVLKNYNFLHRHALASHGRTAAVHQGSSNRPLTNIPLNHMIDELHLFLRLMLRNLIKMSHGHIQ